MVGLGDPEDSTGPGGGGGVGLEGEEFQHQLQKAACLNEKKQGGRGLFAKIDESTESKHGKNKEGWLYFDQK